MKIKLPAIIAVALFATTSFTAMAATEVDRQQAQDLQSIGSVSVSAVKGTMDDATHKLSQKAEEMGATHYRVVGIDSPGDSSLWSGTAEIYR
ncbi:YdgH/BhsA/McbA-like domain containing protein [Pantoea sp. B65]|uniref:YdgH/BhsA/McbA-like domain containing protein n=1 Tax=Pantoea sp. B65 TaxID=2813359 RepID=UPI0039B69A2E